jgi:glutamyl-tRNA reductase
MRLVCVGISHKTAPLSLREKLAFDTAGAEAALRELRRQWPEAEFLLLSTCNRTEVYTARPLHGRPREEDLHAWLVSRAPSEASSLSKALYAHAGVEAVRHVFCVAAGLESLVPGEGQIVSQIKLALAEAQRVKACGAALAALAAEALHVAKHVRSETPIAEGRVSVASVALDAIRRAYQSLAGKCVLSIGAGKMNDLLLRRIGELKPGKVVATNRSLARTRELAKRYGASAARFGDLPDLLRRADVVVTSTSSPRPILTAEMVRRAMQRRRRPMLILDLAVPRDVEPSAGDTPRVTRMDLDDLESVVAASIQVRRKQMDAARNIVEEHVEAFLREASARDVGPTLERLYARLDAVLESELAEAKNKLAEHNDAPQDLDVLRRSLRRALRRFCHPAVETLRAQGGETAAAHAETLRKLFDL